MKMKRVLSLLLALVMTFSLLTLPSYAEDEDTAEETTSVEAVTSAEDAASEKDFSALTVAEQYAALMAMEDEAAIEAAFNTLTEAQQTALQDYAMEQAIANYVAPETVVFTEAGPFMPAVNVASARKLMKAAPMKAPKTDDNGVEFTKKATLNPDGKSYTITMEAWATGTSVTTTSTKPVDIVLVLDQSGSMAYDFNGDPTSTNSNRRQYAMKQAVNNFIDAVNAKYDAQESDHRMAIVGFGDYSTGRTEILTKIISGWTKVDDAGAASLKSGITALPDQPSGGTPTDDGMAEANKLINGTGYTYNGNNTDRQKVVILFTDGVPGNSGFSTSVANSAIASAKALKDAGVTVYTVGIFAGANPDQMYGDRQFFANLGMTFEDELFHKRDVWAYSDGSINSQWEVRNGIFARDYDVSPIDVPAGNRFLNFISSNYKGTDEIGIKSIDTSHGVISYGGFKITKNFDRTASSYYLTAADSTSLNNIFETISQQMDSASTTLGSKTVVKDTISPYFKAPANASAVQLYTEAYNGTSFDGTRQSTTDVSATVNNGVVSVTGFDFAKEFVSDTKKSDNTYGKKLIIEFTVSPKDGFLGGNNVPTNGEAAIYDKEGGTKVEEQPSPVVNVPLANLPSLTASDKNIYLLGTVPTAADLGTIVKPTGADAWKADFVEFSAIKADKTVSNTEDTTVNLSVKISPKFDGTDAIGTVQNAVTKTATANVNVFKPEVTFMDSTVYYGDNAPESYDDNLVSIKWMHVGVEADSAKMTGTAPVLTWTYTPGDGVEDSIIKTTEDIPVSAVATITMAAGTSENITKYVTFKHQDCNPACGWNETELNGDPAFLLHVKTCSLKVTKVVTGSVDDNQSFIFNVSGGNIPQSMKATVQMGKNDNSVTIVGLPTGTYTVTEDQDWSWRYEAQEKGVATADLNTNHDAAVTITNSRTRNLLWLSGENFAINYVGGIKASGTFVSGN